MTSNAGRPQAGWGRRRKRHENPISQIVRFGGDMNSQILKKH
jgi:hypothetical protein